MIDKSKLNAILEEYKAAFPSWWPDEKFKWEAIKRFHDNWNVDAEDFCEMFKKATDKTYGLLASGYAYPKAMILNFTQVELEAVRQMFRVLYDEERDLTERIEYFQAEAERIRSTNDDGTWRNHYQNTNAISTYLWFMYPDKYYIYKYEEARSVASEISLDYKPKKNGSIETMLGGFKLYDEICEVIQQDKSFREMLDAVLDDNCYPDPYLRTMAIDIGFYVSRKKVVPKIDWYPTGYSPNLSITEWIELLNDSSVFTNGSKEIMKRMKDYGGQATCKQLSTKYGETPNFYNTGSSSLAQRIAEKTNCPLFEGDKNSKLWPILYVGKWADNKEEGSYIWKLRDELSQALDKVDLSNVKLFADDNKDAHGYWWLTANPAIWSFSEIKVGDEQNYTMYNAKGNKRKILQNFLDAKVGDAVLCYETDPVKKIVALGTITQENDGKVISFKKEVVLGNPVSYLELKDCPELQQMEFLVKQNGSLFKLTKGEYDFIMEMIEDRNPQDKQEAHKKYTKADFLSKVYMDEARYDVLAAQLKHKKNIILQGAPGVGKTFAAKKLAYSIMGEEDDSRIELVQFHQNYSYEDFVMGYRPNDKGGFDLTDGIFYRFCQKAANKPELDHFFIIDEINRGNLSKIFGELLMLIEKDYRDTKATLAYSGLPFSVPSNLYIIGMMNTADRSLAMIDYALRRRFSFFDMEPGFSSEGFMAYQNGLNNETFNELIEQIRKLNKEITNDSSLGRGFQIGHSYFCGQEPHECTTDWMRSVVEFDILPTLAEYWFDNNKKLETWIKALRGVFDA